tara:strand:- start:336 stop:593 length:258 start_codon:yes stop_codon:yes gene_type:complete
MGETNGKDETKKPKSMIDKASTIEILTGEEVRARRPGTKVAKIFDCYKNGQTVEAWLEAAAKVGGGMNNLRKDVEKGRINLKKAA